MTTNEDRWNNFTHEEKLAYFGGLIDGEGCITLSSHGNGLRPIIQLQMTCKETVQRFAEFFGLKTRELKSPSRLAKTHWKPIFHARAECKKAYPIIKALRPYLFTKYKDCEKPMAYYDDRMCERCGEKIPSERNKASAYCSDVCQKREKNKRAYKRQKGAN